MDRKDDRGGSRPAALPSVSPNIKAPTPQARSGRALRILATLALTVAVLYFGKPVLMPIAMAVLLTLLLSPVVHALERRHIARVPAVILVVCMVSTILLLTGWILSVQLVGLAQELPSYKEQLKTKIAAIRPDQSENSWFRRLRDAVTDISREIEANPDQQPAGPPQDNKDVENLVEKGTQTESADAEGMVEWLGLRQKPQLVVVVPETTSTRETIMAALASVSGPLATLGLVIVLVIFLLITQEDVRDRLVRLAGTGRLSLTTKTLADIRARISRYLLVNALVNGGYGLVVGTGLLLIGVDYALLWGFLAAILRFVPYLGPIAASLLPIGMSFIQFPGWSGTLLTVAFFIVLELVTNNLIEPLAYGRSAGVSIVAILVSALFWTWVWGPVGLALSVPMTVLLAVLGKHVPELQPLGIALGDEPPLEPCVTFYQRLLAGDQDEAESLLEEQTKTRPLAEVCDTILIPALVLAERDRENGALTDEQIDFIWNCTGGLLEELRPETPDTADSEVAAARPRFPYVLGYSAQDTADDLALDMLAAVAEAQGVELMRVGRATLVSELLESISTRLPEVICLSALGRGGIVQLRYVLKRIRHHYPHIRILVGRWGYTGDKEKMTSRLMQRGATSVVTTTIEALDFLNRIAPIVPQTDTDTPPAVATPTSPEKAVTE